MVLEFASKRLLANGRFWPIADLSEQSASDPKWPIRSVPNNRIVLTVKCKNLTPGLQN
jgi:hypothetical protein